MISSMTRFVNNVVNKQSLLQNSKQFICFSAFKSTNFIDKSFENRNFDELTVDSFNELITDQKIKDKIQVILSEYEYQKYTTLRVPNTLTSDQMKDLLSIEESYERIRWFEYLFIRNRERLKSDVKRKQHGEQYWKEKRELYAKNDSIMRRTGIFDNNQQLVYGLWHNTLFTKIPTTKIRHYYSHRLRNAALFGTKLVIDMDFDKYMKLSECRQLANQIQLLYNYNRYKTEEPFDLHFTNCNESLPTIQAMKKYLPNHSSPDFMAEFKSQSYLELFPKDKLVYLTPDSEEPLKAFNCEDIHIIGGLLDKTFHEPITYIKAKKEGIRTARLPIDEHILWASGSKYLCLNHMIAILHDFRMTGNWFKSMTDNIPKRKQKTFEEVEYEDRMRKQKLNRFAKRKSHLKKHFDE